MSEEAKVIEEPKPPALLDLLIAAPAINPIGIDKWHKDNVNNLKAGCTGVFADDMANSSAAIAMEYGLMVRHGNSHPLGKDLSASEMETLQRACAICEAKLNQRTTSTIYGKIYARVAGSA